VFWKWERKAEEPVQSPRHMNCPYGSLEEAQKHVDAECFFCKAVQESKLKLSLVSKDIETPTEDFGKAQKHTLVVSNFRIWSMELNLKLFSKRGKTYEPLEHFVLENSERARHRVKIFLFLKEQWLWCVEERRKKRAREVFIFQKMSETNIGSCEIFSYMRFQKS
jgi:hypothetical protein